MPRILRIINRFNLGGPTYNAAYLTKYLEPEFETMLVGGLKDESEDSSEFITQGLGITPVIISEMRRKISPLNDYTAYRKIKKLITEFKPDIVHTHASKAGALGRMAAWKLRVPVIMHTFHGHIFHSYFSGWKTSLYKSIEKKLATRSTKIIAISEKQKLELVEEYGICPEEKTEVIPLGFDLSRFREGSGEKRAAFRKKYGLEDHTVAIGIIGRLVPVKNHELFLHSIKYVQEKSHHEIRAFVIGDGETRKTLENTAYRLGIENSVIFTSWLREVDSAYAGLDIVALTSLNEGTPVSLIEAQAAGKAIVSTRVGGIENVVIENETALLSDVSNQLGFCENLLNLVENKDARTKLQQSGWRHVERSFHYTRLVQDMKRLYFSLLGQKAFSRW